MTDRSLRIGVAAVATAGLALTAYLLYARESGAQLVCTTGGCETVQESRYAEIFGLPVAALGLVTYIWLLLTSWSRTELARAGQAAVALAACAFSTYLVYVQLHLINAVCELCLVSDGLVAVAAVLALMRLRAA
ncbi:MAG TPA: vitamin K epoxide reductase family protein [Caldimonas sp.]|nr:vitamin K epoxide reductase family protein [Caldimonas sp.]